MSNSPLVNYTRISPCSSNPRNQPISKITIHHMAGNLSVEACGSIFSTIDRQGSSNYGIGTDGRVGMYVEECNRAWTSGSRENDNAAVTIEVANDVNGGDWHVSDVALAKLIDLCVDICQRNGIAALRFTGDATGNLTMHKYFQNTLCPGPYLESKFSYIAEQVNARLSTVHNEPVQPEHNTVYDVCVHDIAEHEQAESLVELLRGVGYMGHGVTIVERQVLADASPAEVIQARDLVGLTNEAMIAKLGPVFTEDQKQSDILASLSFAQFILESGYGKSTMAVESNNCFSMKASLSGNSWAGSKWDGASVYTIETQEQNTDGSWRTVMADFRRYASVNDSIADHSAYLLGAMNANHKRYAGLQGCTNYKAAAQIVKDGGYATDLNYVSKLVSLVERWNLTRFDVGGTSVEPQPEAKPDVPYTVRVSVPNLKIRKGPGTNYSYNSCTGIGIFTIVEESAGAGSDKGWGKLKSGAGWIALDYTTKV